MQASISAPYGELGARFAGYEAACWSAAGAKVGPLHRFILGLFAATN
jgi:hypothetical protein